MTKSSSRPQPPGEASKNSTRPWWPLKKSRWQFVAASVLLTIWIVFLVAMAAYN